MASNTNNRFGPFVVERGRGGGYQIRNIETGSIQHRNTIKEARADAHKFMMRRQDRLRREARENQEAAQTEPTSDEQPRSSAYAIDWACGHGGLTIVEGKPLDSAQRMALINFATEMPCQDCR